MAKKTKKKAAKKFTKKKTKKKVSKKSTKRKAVKKKAKSKSSEDKSDNKSERLRIPSDYSINNNIEDHNKHITEEEFTNRAEWLLELKNKSQELLNILKNWSEAYEKKDIENDSWIVRGDSENERSTKENSLQLFKPEQITEYLENNIIKWIKEPSDPQKSYRFTLEDFEKVFEKICHIRSENTTPMGFSSDVRHLGRFLEIVDNNIKSMLEKHG